jgi:hypothetical protein
MNNLRLNGINIMLENALIWVGLVLLVAGMYCVSVILKRPNKPNLLSATPDKPGEKYERDFVCLHLGPKGSIATCRGVTVRATRTNTGNE